MGTEVVNFESQCFCIWREQSHTCLYYYISVFRCFCPDSAYVCMSLHLLTGLPRHRPSLTPLWTKVCCLWCWFHWQFSLRLHHWIAQGRSNLSCWKLPGRDKRTCQRCRWLSLRNGVSRSTCNRHRLGRYVFFRLLQLELQCWLCTTHSPPNAPSEQLNN